MTSGEFICYWSSIYCAKSTSQVAIPRIKYLELCICVNMRTLIIYARYMTTCWNTILDLQVKKELSLCHKLKFSNPYMFATWWKVQPLIFQTTDYLINRIHSLKYIGLQIILKTIVCGKDLIPLNCTKASKKSMFWIKCPKVLFDLNFRGKNIFWFGRFFIFEFFSYFSHHILFFYIYIIRSKHKF